MPVPGYLSSMRQLGLFDPLLWLQANSIGVTITPAGGIDLAIDWRTSASIAAEARQIVREYGWLIKLQVEAGGVSVHKLYARGRVRVSGGKVVRAG